MRKNRSDPTHHRKDIQFGDFEDMSDDEFSELFQGRTNRKGNARKRRARRKIERYKEDKELAYWIDDPHLSND